MYVFLLPDSDTVDNANQSQLGDDSLGRISVVRSKTDAEAQGATVVITPTAMAGPLRRPAGGNCGGGEGLRATRSQITRRVKAIATAAGLLERTAPVTVQSRRTRRD